MAKGNFSNNGVMTYNVLKNYVSVRLQQGVPLLDRDWNELEEIRMHYTDRIRRLYLGYGVPDQMSFFIKSVAPSPNDFLITQGHCIVNGQDVLSFSDLRYSQQHNVPPLPAPTQDDVFYVYLEVALELVDSTMDPALKNAQDINLETCVRYRLNWSVQYARHPTQPPSDSFLLAKITRPKGVTVITQQMIEDKRRTGLQLSAVVDKTNTQEAHLKALDDKVVAIQKDIANLKVQVARMLWDVEPVPTKTTAYFGDTIPITVTVKNGLGEPMKNARLYFATDWGSVDVPNVTTDNNGKATVKLIGVESDTPPSASEVAVMHKAVERVTYAEISNPGALEYSKIQFEASHLGVLSRYSPQSEFIDISYNPATGPVVSVPPSRPATVMVYAKEGGGTAVRGIGSVQVFFRMWVRDWVRTVIWQVAANVNVDARVGAVLGESIKNKYIDPIEVSHKIPPLLDDIHRHTYEEVYKNIYTNPGVDKNTNRAGYLGEIIGRETTATVGARTENAMRGQMQQYRTDAKLNMEEKPFLDAVSQMTTTANQYSAGQAQRVKQEFNAYH